MKMLVKICLVSSLVFLLGLAGAVSYEFGSKVANGDTDIGHLLYNVAPDTNVMFWDIGTPGYDQADPVYLHMGPLDPSLINPVIKSNDIRLTAFDGRAPGTKVSANDNDIGKTLTAFPDVAIAFTDLYGSLGYDFDDLVYVHIGALGPTNPAGTTITNDIRLNKINGLDAGTKVFDYHPDHNKPLTALMGLPTITSPTIATLRFYNTNGNYDPAGNPIYDDSDSIYLDFSIPITVAPFGSVAVNDVRLTV